MALTSKEDLGSDLFEGRQESLPATVIFLTNRFNLLQILSSGLVGPRYAYDKYYEDLLSIAPGRLPLVLGPIGDELQRLVSGGDDTSFPVALELEATLVVSDKLPALDRSGGSKSAAIGAPGIVAWAPAGVFPLTVFRRALFRSSAELKEHKAREYENVQADTIPMSVDPTAFSGVGGAGQSIVEWLKGLPPAGPSRGEYVAADRLTGAKALAAMTLPRAPAAATTIASLFGTPPIAESKAALSTAPWVSSKSIASDGSPAGADLNARLFYAAASVLRSVDRFSVWRPTDVLAEIDRRVRAKKLSKKDDVELLKNTEHIRGILRNERDFKAFKQGVGLPTAKALLMVLLRPEPERLAMWSNDETGADDETLVTAGVYGGLLNGRERMPLTFRPPPLDRALATEQAAMLSAMGGGVVFVERSPRVELRTSADGGSGSLFSGEKLIVSWKTGPPSVASILASLNLEDPYDRQTAVDICRIAMWPRCVRTSITSEDSRAIVEGAKGRGISVTVGGWPTIAHDLDANEFNRHIGQSFPRDREDATRDFLGRRSSERPPRAPSPAVDTGTDARTDRQTRN